MSGKRPIYSIYKLRKVIAIFIIPSSYVGTDFETSCNCIFQTDVRLI